AHAGGRFLSPESMKALVEPQWTLRDDPPNGETQRGSICANGLSVHLIGRVHAAGCRDDLFGDGGRRLGHLGEAYGLIGGLWLEMRARRGFLYLVTGTSDDPHRLPAHTGFTRLEEKLVGGLRALPEP
ncbi:MAG: serine hydrolase, partial [Alphaproteobacteria bacterium]